MMDIASSLLIADARRSVWSKTAVGKAAAAFARSVGGEVDWDEGAGEDWLRIVTKTSVVGLISAVIPLVFSTVEVSQSAVGDQAQWILLRSLAEPVLTCELATLQRVFGDSRRFDDLDHEEFSANDLWFFTV